MLEILINFYFDFKDLKQQRLISFIDYQRHK